MRTFEPSNPRKGFTLIEVLVATTVMAIMVLMLGGVFQQASSSWDSGYVRANGGMAVRAVAGAVARDLATAVDGRSYGLGAPIKLEGGNLEFYRLKDGPGGGVELVKYSSGTTVVRTADGASSTIYDSTDQGNAGTVVVFSFYMAESDGGSRKYEDDSDFSDNAAWTVPFVKVRCEMKRTGSITGLSVRSWGKDGKMGTGDDIVVR